MGYTAFEKEVVSRNLNKFGPSFRVIDYGAQCDYTIKADPPAFISEWYRSIGGIYSCIDLAGDNNSLRHDLSHPLPYIGKYNLVGDAGTSEHIAQMKSFESVSFHEGAINSIYPKEIENVELGFYNGWKNKHDILLEGGLMINFNPLTGNWPGHCYSYLPKDFYDNLIKISDYEVLETGTHAACGNTTDGWNLWAVLKKIGPKFPSFEEFQTLNIQKS